MSNYDIFAMYYDTLTKNVDYTGRADYLEKLLREVNHCAGITLDLACGTGSLTLELYKRGFDIYGIDSSVAMLSVAKEKAGDANILFLCQKMQNLDLYGTVDTVICALDSINHLSSLQEMQKAFDKVSFFMNPNGYFIFDFNTIYKHREVLRDNVFIYDIDPVFCVWQNKLRPKINRVDISLDFFKRDHTAYHRSREHFSEITCDPEKVIEMLKKAGFGKIQIFDDLSFDLPRENSQRIVFAAKKEA
ncbi:MAG: class I SAM-dependent methyltransferase [Oscillospiraceae bacterium]